MSTTPVLLKWNDAGAPELSSTRGSIVDLFKWALPQLGWTLEYEDAPNFKAAFRNSPVDGLGYYFQMEHDPGGNWDDLVLTGYTSMTAIDTGADLFGWVRVPCGQDTSSPVGGFEYFFIGDNRTFYFGFLARSSTSSGRPRSFMCIPFGEFKPFSPTDTEYFAIYGEFNSTSLASSDNFGLVSGTTISAPCLFTPFSADGLRANVGLPDSNPHKNRLQTGACVAAERYCENAAGNEVVLDNICISGDEDDTIRGMHRGAFAAVAYPTSLKTDFDATPFVASSFTTVHGSEMLIPVHVCTEPAGFGYSDLEHCMLFFRTAAWG